VPFLLLLLVPFGRSAELATAVSIVAVGVLLWRSPGLFLSNGGSRTALLLWGCFVTAGILSLYAAVNLQRSGDTVLAMLRYLPLAWFTVYALRQDGAVRKLFLGIAIVTALWTLDAWMQALTGYSIRGHAAADRLTGIFGAGDPKIGQVLAVLAPFLLAELRHRWGRIALIVGALLLFGPILLSGSRASWVTYGLVLLILLWRETRRPLQFATWAGMVGLAAMLAMGLAWQQSPRFDTRMQRTLLVLQGNEQSLNTALSGRLSIWATSLRMFKAHPWTGVGVRGFRYAYPRYAAPGDPFVNRQTGEGAYYAHQIVLEILSESGVLGLLSWLLGVAVAWHGWRRAAFKRRELAWPAGVAVLAVVFPFNTSLAVYSAWWGLIFWWLLAIWLGALGTPVVAVEHTDGT